MTMSIDVDKHGTVDTSKCLRGMNKQLLDLTKFQHHRVNCNSLFKIMKNSLWIG